MLFFISIWLLFIFSNSVKNFYLLALCFYSSLPSFVVVWTPSQVDCLCPCHLVLLGFYLVPSSEICSSAASLCLSFCLHVYVCSRLVTFLDLGEVALCRKHPCSVFLSLRKLYVLGFPLRGQRGSLCCGALGLDGPLVWLGVVMQGGPRASAGSLVGRIRVTKTLGLLPTYWQMKPVPGVRARLLAGRARSWSLTVGPRTLALEVIGS